MPSITTARGSSQPNASHASVGAMTWVRPSKCFSSDDVAIPIVDSAANGATIAAGFESAR